MMTSPGTERSHTLVRPVSHDAERPLQVPVRDGVRGERTRMFTKQPVRVCRHGFSAQRDGVCGVRRGNRQRHSCGRGA